MKSLKIALASLVLLAITSAFVTLKSEVRTPVNVDNQLLWDGGSQSGADFVIVSGTKSWLNDAVNWDNSFASFSSGGCTGSSKICKLRIEYTYDTQLGETDPTPSIQNVIDAVYNAYNDPNPPASHSFSTPITFTVGLNPVVITVTIVQKS